MQILYEMTPIYMERNNEMRKLLPLNVYSCSGAIFIEFNGIHEEAREIRVTSFLRGDRVHV